MVRQERPKRWKPRGPATKRSNTRKARVTVDYTALAQFRLKLRLFLAFSDTNAEKAGLTSQQYQALLAIKGFDSERPMFIGELAKFLLTKHHSTVELVDRMAKLGLLQKATDADDKRRMLVTLTKKGQLLLQKVAAVHFKRFGSSSRMLRSISKLLADA